MHDECPIYKLCVWHVGGKSLIEYITLHIFYLVSFLKVCIYNIGFYEAKVMQGVQRESKIRVYVRRKLGIYKNELVINMLNVLYLMGQWANVYSSKFHFLTLDLCMSSAISTYLWGWKHYYYYYCIISDAYNLLIRENFINPIS